ncbi:MAG: sigma 54-interacting transcriptional regulator [Chitinispirillia bacterium]|jgi:transcriptional regulator with GAF, ATPase, and Fis domain
MRTEQNGIPEIIPTLERICGGENNKVFSLTKRLTRIGSDKSCDISLPYKGINKEHAFVLFKMGQLSIKNICEPETLKVNGRPVSDPVVLSDGDKVEIGLSKLIFHNKSHHLTKDKVFIPQIQNSLKRIDQEELLRIFSSVLDVISQITRESNYNHAATRLVQVTGRIMSCDGGRLLKKDSDGKLETVTSFPEKAGKDRFCQTAISWADRENSSVLIADAGDEKGLPLENSMNLKEIRSVLCAPLKENDSEPFGYLYLDRLKGHNPFNSQDKDLFERLRILFSDLLLNVKTRENQAESIKALQESHWEDEGRSLVFSNKNMEILFKKAAKVINLDVPVLIEGETGTGKEVLARYIHYNGSRKENPFIAINCGAIPENLMESEFFGHQKGAFTGANTNRDGHLVAAGNGTIFLDEVSELPLGLQVKLLRALQEKEITPVGASIPVKINSRIIAASNKNLEKEVKEGRFRQDLIFRLNVVKLIVPPLRERGGDVILLANYFIKQYAIQYGTKPKLLASSAEKAVISYYWPGNVRELQNRIHRAVILTGNSSISVADLELPLSNNEINCKSTIDSMRVFKERAEMEGAIKALTISKGNISLASKLLKLDRMVFTRLLNKLGIDASDYKKRG